MAPFRLLLSTLAAMSFVAFGSASHLPRNELELSVNPPHDNLIPLSAYGHGGVLTNAERMKRGLGLRKPVIGDRNVRRQDPSGTPTTPNEPEPTPPASTCTGRTGYIRASPAAGDASGNAWLSKDLNDFGEYGYTTIRSPDSALKVTLCGSDGVFNIKAVNSPTVEDIPYVGAIPGYANSNDDLSPGSFHYAYIGATVETPNGSPPVSGDNSFTRAAQISRNVESAIWSIDGNNVLSASWVNTDGTRVHVPILYAPSAAAFVITAGPDEFRSNFGDSREYIFTFEEDVIVY